MANPTVTAIQQGPTGTLRVICGAWMYEFPVAAGVMAALFPAYTNPTAYQPGWTTLTLTPADDISAALAVAGPNATLTLAPGAYRETLKITVPAA